MTTMLKRSIHLHKMLLVFWIALPEFLKNLCLFESSLVPNGKYERRRRKTEKVLTCFLAT